MALGSTQPLTEMSTGNLPGGKGRPARKASQLRRHVWADCLENVRASTSHNPMASTARHRDSFTFSLECDVSTVLHMEY
jgi:hypothetical protein